MEQMSRVIYPKQFIQEVLIDEIGDITKRHAYLSFGLICSGNEEYDCLRKGKEVCEQTIQMFEPDKKTDGTVEYGDWMLKNPIMGWLTRLEPATSAFTERRSNQLSYSHRF